MTTGRDIICISSIDWDFIWQGHQEIMSRLAANGNRVLFVENTGVRPPRLSDLPRLRSRIRNWRRGTQGFREERPNLFIHSPMVLPFPYLWFARWLNQRILVRSLTRWMRAVGASRPMVWTFLPTPLTRAVIAAIDPALTIYYCIDDLASSSPEARRIAPSEESMFREADLVFVTSEKLRQRAAQHSERVHLFPFAVNLATFEKARDEGGALPEDLAKLKRPVAGYVGGLHQWVDQPLLAAVAERMPDVSFAMVGPPQVDVSALERLPNIHLFGQRKHAQLPGYVAGFDVGLVPYRITEYTANVYPTKLNEYLIMGKPVVATDLFEIRRFNQEHGPLIEVASTADAFAAEIRKAIAGSATADVGRRIDVARSNSWERRLETMSTLIANAETAKQAGAVGWEERLRRIYALTRRRTAQALIGLAAAIILVFYTPVIWWAAAPLQLSAPPQTADAIVVFAGGVGESGKAGVGVQERVSQAVALYKGGYAPRIIFSSGYVFTLREAEVMKAIAADLGVPADAILLEERAANTHENVTFTDRILRENHWNRILLVSSPYHMRRATMTWRKQAPAITVTPTPVTQSQFYLHYVGADADQIGGILHEYLAIAQYLVERVAVIPSFRTVRIVSVATLVAVVVSMVMVEAWVRYSWDEKKGRPGFYLSDPVRGQRLAPGYDGWFAGVPVKINQLGFRDDREYTLAKSPGTFRIIVLGDSVTFGHGAPFATTYPFLVEERLKAWRPDVKWEVWNLGVPGYNTSQELAYLEQVGQLFSPDLVVVGFYPNDFTANERVAEPSLARRLGSAMQAIVQRTMYWYQFYKRAYLTMRWRLMTDKVDRQRIEHLATEDELLEPSPGSEAATRALGPVDYIVDPDPAAFECPGGADANRKGPTELARALRTRAPDLASWFEAVDGLQHLHTSGVFRVMFFINMAPIPCVGVDRFADGGSLGDDDALLEVLGKGAPVVSSTRAFLHYHPSQMPAAGGHSLGNSNRVKADVLFEFLKTSVLPPLLPTGSAP